MNLSWIDWAILIVSVVALRMVSFSTRHYMKGVADFLSANRSAGRYLLTIASQMGGVGVVTFIGCFEVTMSAGMSPNWWAMMLIPVTVIILLTGWVFYRFRETRALTMAQFFEMRYSKNLRIFAGLLCWTSGILNFGIFPAVAARFFIYFCGLPQHYHCPGIPFELSTFATAMIIDLGLALSFVLMGGQISVMITECVQGIFCTIALLVVSVAVMVQVKWPQMVHAMQLAPANQSMLNPFHTSGVQDFNLAFGLIGFFGAFYSYMSWQGTSGFYSSARTPHEQKMGGIIGVWRGIPQALLIMLLPLAALAVLKLPEFATKAAIINESLKHIANTSVRGEMQVPIAMAVMLPVGIKGLLATIMLFVSFTCHDTYMHSWGSIFVQDVLMPLRKKPLGPEEHIKYLRFSIMGVAIFAFVFSLLYPPSQKIFFFFDVTGTIWLAGSGAVIIGGLYWKKGTTAGAFAAFIVGAIVGVTGLVLPVIWKTYLHHSTDFPINGRWTWLYGMLSASLTYVFVSLATCKKEFNLEKMLNRGKYAKEGEHVVVEKSQSKWQQIVGITSEFSKFDKFLAIALIVWQGANFGFFVVFSIINLIFHNISDMAWARWWHFNIIFNLVVSVPVIVWFSIGGVLDMKALFKMLTTAERDASDNGTVKHEEEIPAESSDSVTANR